MIAGLLQRSRIKQRQLNQQLEGKNQEISRQSETLQQANQKLLELDDFKQTMTGMIAHDLKNPLNTIIGYSENGTENTSKVINQSGKRILNLAQNMLDVQKFEDAQIQPKIENLSAYKLAKRASQQVNLLAQEKNVSIRNDISPSIFIQADAELTERIFVNLLTNAIKYSSQNQIITIKASNKNEKVKIQVEDEGIGIPSELLPKIFDKFTQVEAKKSGIARSTGLGLTFCKMATEIQGGTIRVESELQKGSTFTFELPKGEKQESSTEQVTDNELTLSKADKATLQPFLEEMKTHSIYQVSELRQIILKIPEQNQALKHLKNELEMAVFSVNQEKFNELMKVLK